MSNRGLKAARSLVLHRSGIGRSLLVLLAVLGLHHPAFSQVKPDASQTSRAIKKILLVTGVDYPGHKWTETAPVLARAIGQDPRLAVTLIDQPSFLAAPQVFDYDVIVLHFMNWEVPAPGPQACANLQRFVREGRGLVLVHFACGAFQDWPEFVELAGRVWDPQLRPHDPHGPYRVDVLDGGHPIVRGLESFETIDELYTCLAGDRPIELLATARSKVDGRDYPMAFVLKYGEGRVFHSPLGHDVAALSVPAVQMLFRRGCAWCAGIPVDFEPTADPNEPAGDAPPKKVILMAGPASHGRGEHTWPEDAILLAECLQTAGNIKKIRIEVIQNGWPKDPAVLDDAAAIVLLSDGLTSHPWRQSDRRRKIRQLAAKGVGLALIHYALAPPEGGEADFLVWVGGYWQLGYSQNPIQTLEVAPATAAHPICRGWRPFTARDEFYYRIRFGEQDKRLVPILTGLLPEAAGGPEILAWAIERQDGGRGFGFTGGHYHANWKIEPFRRMVLNAILWTAKVAVPKEGVLSRIPEPRGQ
ncbi:MAG: ThuA domain-containing protein [Sedimentisphaerales bacterium]|nr:ThuA domain-containing protein [Sedimentisphaerales bacterium]